jgi:hypothetical protein
VGKIAQVRRAARRWGAIMILRFFWLSAIILLLSLRAYGYTVVVTDSDRSDGRFFTATANEKKIAVEKALDECLKSRPRSGACRVVYELDGSATAPQCLAIVQEVRELGDFSERKVYRASAGTKITATMAALSQCKSDSSRLCNVKASVCDPEPAQSTYQLAPPVVSPEQTPSAATEPLPSAPESGISSVIAAANLFVTNIDAVYFYSAAFGFGLFVLLALYDSTLHERRSIYRLAISLAISCAAAGGVTSAALVAPGIWKWINALSRPALVLLVTITCGLVLLLVPLEFWRTLKRGRSFRTAASETPQNSAPATNDGITQFDKKAH